MPQRKQVKVVKPSTPHKQTGNKSLQPFRSPAKSPLTSQSRSALSPHNNRVRKMRTREDLEELAMQCIKLSQSNKISQKNAWDLNLTSHLGDVLEFQKTDRDETNFQMASCTLDASVRIWGARVDSVHQDTYSTLNMLHQTNDGGKKKGGKGNAGEGDEGDVGDDGVVTKKRSGPPKTVITIEKNVDNINYKELDREVCIDPLLRKASAAFDESGVRGLLLNNVAVHSLSVLSFDSSDVRDCAIGPESDKRNVGVDDDLVDDLRLSVPNSNVHKHQLCPYYASFKFGVVDAFDSAAAVATKDEGRRVSNIPDDIEALRGADAQSDLANVGDENFAAVFMSGEVPQEDELADSLPPLDQTDEGEPMGFTMESFGDMEVPQDVPEDVSMSGGERPRMGTSLVPTTLRYDMATLDKICVQSWAGPQNWKFPARQAQRLSSGASAPKVAKSKKPRMFIDFTTTVDPNLLSATSRASTVLTKTAEEKAKQTPNTLPRDAHYQVRQLTQLFVKPMWTVQATEVAVPVEGEADGVSEKVFAFGEVQLAPEVHDHNGVPLTFEVPEDNYDMPDFDHPADDNGFSAPGVDDLPAPNHFTEGDSDIGPEYKVETVQINYARTTRKVDVKSLKASLWKTLRGPARPSIENDNPNAAGSASEKDDGGEVEEQTFQNVLSNIPARLDGKNKLSEVSVQFCFICLLHLANEKNLSLTQPDGILTDITIRQNSVTV